MEQLHPNIAGILQNSILKSNSLKIEFGIIKIIKTNLDNS
jgi:hypothetical protein